MRRADEKLAEPRADPLPPRPEPSTKVFGKELLPVEKRLATIWGAVLDRDPASFDPGDHFFELGADDAAVAGLHAGVLDEWGLSLADDQITETPTLGALAQAVKAQARLAFGRPGAPEVIAAGAPGRYPVVCVAGMGDTNLGWRRVARLLDPSTPLIGIEAIGFADEVQPLTRVEQIARYHVPALRELVAGRPVVFCGHSFGGSVAYELARQFREAGLPVAGVVLLDTPTSRKLGRLSWTIRRVPWKVTRVYKRHRAGINARVMLWLRRRGLAMPKTGEQRVRWVIYGQRMAYRRYRPRPYDGDLVLLQVDSLERDRDHTLGWGKLVKGELEQHLLPGLHEDMLRTVSVQATSKVLDECFRRLTTPPAEQR